MNVKQKIFMVSYGGGHANIMKYIYSELYGQSDIEICYLALTAAPNILRAANIDYITANDMAMQLPYYGEILRLGREFGLPQHNDKSGIHIEDTIAYYGIGMYDLIQRHGEKDALTLFSKKGRKIFLPVNSMRNFLRIIKPNVCVITASPRMEKATGIAASKLNIPVVRINDLPICEQIEHECFLCVMNEWAKKYAILKAGISSDHVIVTGQPIFEGNAKFDSDMAAWINEQLNLSEYHNIIVFFTENGKNQTQELLSLYNIAKDRQDVLFIVKIHPNQSIDDIIMNELPNVVVRKEEAKYFLHIADIVITTFSTTGMEAAILGIPLIVVNYTKQEYPLDYVSMGLALEATDSVELGKRIDSLLDKTSGDYLKLAESRLIFSFVKNASQNICEVIFNCMERRYPL